MTTSELLTTPLQRYLTAIAEEPSEHDHPTAHHRVKRLVGDVMTHGAIAAHEGALFKEIVDAITRNRISAVPVIDAERHVIGVVSESDLLTRIVGEQGSAPRGVHHSRRDTQRKLHGATARELMTTPAVTVKANTTVADAARIASRHKVRRLPVVDDAGILIGIVTRADMLAVFLRYDGDIREDVEKLIRYHTEFDRSSITVQVEEGIVTLSGELERALLAARLVYAVRAINGVIDVVDQLRFRFNDTVMPPPRGGIH
jgi:CBS-domain-containing membrane protein